MGTGISIGTEYIQSVSIGNEYKWRDVGTYVLIRLRILFITFVGTYSSLHSNLFNNDEYCIFVGQFVFESVHQSVSRL